ncbi:MAG: hypothetical protein ACE5GA_06765, partial [Candidatus Zixiibacteriota bacterium]
MALSTKTVGWIVVFLAVALTGLLALQVSLFSSAMELKESVFRRNVTAALSRVSEDLSVNEAALALRASGVSDSLIAQSRVLAIITDDTTAPGELEMTAAIGQSEFLTELESDSGRIHYTVRDKQHVTVRVCDPNSGLDTALVDSVHSPGKYYIAIDEESMPRDREIW